MTSERPSAPRQPPFGMRSIMDLFDIGPGVAYTVIASVVLVFLAGVVFFIRSAPPSEITISSGPEGSSFHRMATKYAKALQANGIKLNILTSNGSFQNLDRIKDPKQNVDLALIQSGVIAGDTEGLDGVVSLGAIGNQPIFFFYRGPAIQRLSQIKGKKVAIGQEGSGMRKIALKLLDLNGIKETDTGGTELLNLDADAATDALEQKKIDAAFIMRENTAGADLRKLMRSQDVRLLSFENANAYVRKIDYLNVLQLPQGVIDFGSNIPAADVDLVGPMIELVADKDLHPALSDLILDAAFSIHARAGLFQKRGEFPMPIEQTIKLSEDAARFYKSGKTLLYRHLPFRWASFFNRMLVVFLPMLVILIPVVRSLPFLFRWRSQMRIRRMYHALMQIEQEFKQAPDPDKVQELQTRFASIDFRIRNMYVRPAYAEQFYHLRGHIDFVRRHMPHSISQ